MNQCECHIGILGTWILDLQRVLHIIEIQICSIQMRTNTH